MQNKDDYESLAAEAKSRWGGTSAYAQYEERSKAKTQAQKDEAAQKLMDVFREFGAARTFSPDSPEAGELVSKLRRAITDGFYTCTDEILRGLGRMYVCDERMRRNIDEAGGEGTALFASRAIEALLG